MSKIILSLSILLACMISASAQNTVSFDNQSGEPALVKLIGSTSSEIEVPDGTKQVVQVLAGKYFIKVRYGVEGKYHYTKGHEFTVHETATTTSGITITLHKAVKGNYGASPITEREFGVGNPTNAAAALGLGLITLVHRTNGDSLELKPDSAEAYNNRGVAKQAKGDSDGAIADYSKAIELKPDYAEAYNNRGIAKGAKGDLDGAIADHTKAIALKPGAFPSAVAVAGPAEDLINAANRGDAAAVQALLDKGAEVNAKDTSGATALIFASQNGHSEVVKALLAKGAEVNAKASNGVTALIMASQNGHLDVVQALLAKGAEVNAKASNGATALIAASQQGRSDVVHALLAAKADVNAKMDDGETAISMATKGGFQEVLQILKGLPPSTEVGLSAATAQPVRVVKIAIKGNGIYAGEIPLFLAVHDEDGRAVAGPAEDGRAVAGLSLSGVWRDIVLDVSSLPSGILLTLALQVRGNQNTHEEELNIHDYKRIAMDKSGVAFPNQVTAVGPDGPYIDIRGLWGGTRVTVKSSAGTMLPVDIAPDGSIVVGKVPADSITIEIAGTSWKYKLFPYLRGATPDLAIYTIIAVP